MKKHEQLVYSAVGLIALFLILVAVNYLITRVPSRIADLTDGKLYTLSDGTKKVLRELTHEGSTIKLLSGRYGPYVTDGSVNASLPKSSNPDALTFAQATELLAARRDMAPAPKRGAFGRNRAVKTTAAKKTTAKKTTAAAKKKKTA